MTIAFSFRSMVKRAVAALAFIALSLQAAQAQETNVEAVTRRLIEAVRAGELQPEVAAEMVATMARHSFHQRLERAHAGRGGPAEPRRAQPPTADPRRAQPQRRGDERRPTITREDYAHAERELMGAVKNGRLTKEQARERLNDMRRMMGGPPPREQARRAPQPPEQRRSDRRPTDRALDARRATPTREQLSEVRQKLGALVEQGKLTEEQARARWKGYLRSLRGSGEDAKPDRRDADAKEQRKNDREQEQIGDF